MFKRTAMVILAIATAFLLYPVDVTVAPEWHVQVVDTEGKPFSGFAVREIWKHYSVEEVSHEEHLVTDVSGALRFPERKMRVSRLRRFFGCGLQIVKAFVHASCGPVAYLIPLAGNDFAETKASLSRTAYRGEGTRSETRIVLERCKNKRKIGVFCADKLTDVVVNQAVGNLI